MAAFGLERSGFRYRWHVSGMFKGGSHPNLVPLLKSAGDSPLLARLRRPSVQRWWRRAHGCGQTGRQSAPKPVTVQSHEEECKQYRSRKPHISRRGFVLRFRKQFCERRAEDQRVNRGSGGRIVAGGLKQRYHRRLYYLADRVAGKRIQHEKTGRHFVCRQ